MLPKGYNLAGLQWKRLSAVAEADTKPAHWPHRARGGFTVSTG